jgi:hypothetical protein
MDLSHIRVSAGMAIAVLIWMAAVSPPKAAAQEPAGPQQAPPAASPYDPAIFQNPIPSDQLAFLSHFAGSPAKNAIRDKQYRKLMHSVIPDCIYHYGWDMSLADALERVLTGSPLPVQIRDGRYFIVSGQSGPYLGGRGFIWIDLKDGIGLGGFFFRPTNGEPTPTVTIFSRQVKEKFLGLSQLPPAFAGDLLQWSADSGVPPITTRYFIGGFKEKILLEHDEDYCAPAGGAPAPPEIVCEQLNADAADVDMNAAYYLEQTHHATNATAWMIVGQDQAAWLVVRDRTCRAGPNPLGCRIRMTREHTHVIINPHPAPTPRASGALTPPSW